jgi:endoglucanase
MKKIILLLSVIVCQHSFGSNIVEILPLTNKIIVVHFDDGYIQHHTSGQPRNADYAVVSPLNTILASQLNSYFISSSNDPYYSNPLNPLEIGRKTKGTDFAIGCESTGFLPVFNNDGCVNSTVDNAKEHWVYLFLPQAMIEGKTYSINTGNLAVNSNSFSFLYNSKTLRSEAVHVNQIGYSTTATQKFGYVYSWLGDKGGLDLAPFSGNTFKLINTTTNTVSFTGTLTFRKDKNTLETAQFGDTPNGNFNGADVYECDFSNFNTIGDYVLSVDGIGISFPFKISCDATRDPFKYVMQGLYQNRSGIALTGSYVQNRPAPHNVQTTPGFAGKLKYTTTKWCDVSNSDSSMDDKPLWEAGFVGDLTDTWGWYQDAGDWDGYLRHMKVPTYLMFLYENNKDSFTDGELQIPESGNGQPDILDEARWLPRFYKRLKDELVAKGWGTGGVGGSRIMGDLWGNDESPEGNGRPSWQDTTRTWIVSGEDAFATYWYAATAAHYAICLQKAGVTDVENINWQQEAINAYIWAQANSGPNDICQEYNIKDLRMYAASSLYKLTGIQSYNTQFVTDFNASAIPTDYVELFDSKAYGSWQYATLPSNLSTNSTVLQKALSSIEATAEFTLLDYNVSQRACRWSGNFYFPMLVGQATTPLIGEGAMAALILKNSKPAKAAQFKEALFNTADYFLGNNPLNMTYITGLGERNPVGIFHQDSWYSISGGVRRGIVPYGAWRADYSGYFGWWRYEWPATTTYPDYQSFPGHERWFDQRNSPLGCEFTIDQTNLMSAFVYGSLLCNNQPTLNNSGFTTIQNKTLFAYPNPSKKEITISGEKLNNQMAKVSNTLGQVFEIEMINNKINLENLQNGLYFINLLDNNAELKSIKLIKQ